MNITSGMSLYDCFTAICGQLQESDLGFGQGTNDAEDESDWMLWHVLDVNPVEEEIDENRKLTISEADQINTLIARRIETQQPLAYIINKAWFLGLQLFVDERVIIPRSFLVEWIPEQFSPWVNPNRVNTILDLCTGSGCIAIALAHVFSGSKIVASDLSEDALSVAQINVDQYQLNDQIALRQGDLFENITEKFDLIVCNPPYVSSERMDRLPFAFRQEPSLAFHSGDSGLEFIKRLLAVAHQYLTEHGVLLVEAGSASLELEAHFPKIPFNWLSTEYDETVVFIITADELMRFSDTFNSLTTPY